MKCEECGQEIDRVMIRRFSHDGTDYELAAPLEETDEDAVWFLTDQAWTDYELSEEEQMDGLRCPHCGKFPFKHKEVQVYTEVRVVCFKEACP